MPEIDSIKYVWGEINSIGYLWLFFGCLPRLWRMHQIGRFMLMPFQVLCRYLPQAEAGGKPPVLLDLGCGHGVFLALVHKLRPDIELVGLDLAPDKIDAARKAFDYSHCPVTELAVRDVADFPGQSVDMITLIDVLYLVPISQWDSILHKCHQCLKPGGRLLLKEMDRTHRFKFALLCAEETLAVKVLGWTLGTDFTFPTPAEIRHKMENAGFHVEQHAIDRGYHVPHALWVGSK